jgi:hypothetical protein
MVELISQIRAYMKNPVVFGIMVFIGIGIFNWAIIQLLSYFCAPPTFWGMIHAILATPAPHCSGMATILSTTSGMASQMILTAISTLIFTFTGTFSGLTGVVKKE